MPLPATEKLSARTETVPVETAARVPVVATEMVLPEPTECSTTSPAVAETELMIASEVPSFNTIEPVVAVNALSVPI